MFAAGSHLHYIMESPIIISFASRRQKVYGDGLSTIVATVSAGGSGIGKKLSLCGVFCLCVRWDAPMRVLNFLCAILF